MKNSPTTKDKTYKKRGRKSFKLQRVNKERDEREIKRACTNVIIWLNENYEALSCYRKSHRLFNRIDTYYKKGQWHEITTLVTALNPDRLALRTLVEMLNQMKWYPRLDGNRIPKDYKKWRALVVNATIRLFEKGVIYVNYHLGLVLDKSIINEAFNKYLDK